MFLSYYNTLIKNNHLNGWFVIKFRIIKLFIVYTLYTRN